MTSIRILGTLIAVAGIVAACKGGELTSSDRICTPGAYVFCRCADKSEGTKLCKDDGASFEACTTGGEDGVCKGGEIDDPNTNNPVTPPPEPPAEPPSAGPEVEACPGKAIALTPGVDSIIMDDTTLAVDDAKGKTGACAVGGGGPDHVYHLQPKGSGALKVTVVGTAPLDPTIYIRTTCTDEASQVSCGETTAAGGTETINLNVVTGHDYFLFIDGASGSKGKYKITAKLTTGSFCGDGKVDTNEACDDINKVDGDGCSNDCKKVDGDPPVTAVPTGNGCPGQPVDVWPGQKVLGSGTTLLYGNTFTNTGTSCIVSASNLNAAQDHIYHVTAHAAGNLVIVATPTDPLYNIELVARSTCADAPSQTGCANDGSAGVAETMTLAVTTGQQVYVAVDGALNSKGPYSITFEIK